jgi:hypothetical protein
MNEKMQLYDSVLKSFLLKGFLLEKRNTYRVFSVLSKRWFDGAKASETERILSVQKVRVCPDVTVGIPNERYPLQWTHLGSCHP